MVPYRTSSRVTIAGLVTVALVFASACAHRRPPGVRVGSSSINRAVMPESERGSAFKRHDEMSMKTTARVNEDAKSDSRDEASAGLPSVFANQPSAPETGAASFESSVVMTPRPAPDQVPAPSHAEQRTPSDTDASAHPLLATILLAVLLVVGWALARAMFDRRVAG